MEENWPGVLCNAPQLGFVSSIFLGIRWRICGFSRKTTAVPCHSHHIMSRIDRCYQHGLSLRMLILVTKLRQCLSGFSSLMLQLFLLPYCAVWKKSSGSVPFTTCLRKVCVLNISLFSNIASSFFLG